MDAAEALAAEDCLRFLSTGGAFLLCVLFLWALFLGELFRCELLLRLEERLLLDAPEGVETGRLWEEACLSNSAKKLSISSRLELLLLSLYFLGNSLSSCFMDKNKTLIIVPYILLKVKGIRKLLQALDRNNIME